MNDETQELHAIHMSVQTAELNVIGFKNHEQIVLSCGLMNIGRGICSVTINPSRVEIQNQNGVLDIEINRPYMKALLELCQNSFSKTRDLLLKLSVRPTTLILLLDRPLSVNLKGDLLIDKETKRRINDISWIFPLK